MSTTVIDSLVVLFGLDPTGYKKGADEVAKAQAALDAKQKKGVLNTDKEEKDLANARKKRQQAVEKQGNDTIKAFGDVGRAIAGMFLGFDTVTGFAKWMAELNQGEAQMGRTSLKIGMGVHELNKWGNATALAGGKAEDAQEAFGKIASEFNTSQVTGQIGPLLAFLRARGVAIQDANGKLRNQGEILEELADKTAQYGSVYQANMFRQAGLNEGEIDYLIQAKALREDQLRIAELNNNLTADQVKQAKALAQEWANTKQEITGAGQEILMDLSPNMLYILHTLTDVGHLLAKIPHMADAVKGALNPFASVAGAIQEDLTAIESHFGGSSGAAPAPAAAPTPQSYAEIWTNFKKGMSAAVPYANSQFSRSVDPVQKRDLLGVIATTEAQLGIPAGMLARIAEQESHFRKDIISGQTRSPAGAVGLMQLMPNVFKGAAQMTPEQQIATAGKELARLYKDFGDWSKAVAAYNDGEGNIRKVLASKKALPEETRRYIAAVAPTPDIHAGSTTNSTANTHTTTVDVAAINVYSNSANPSSVADETGAGLQRKLSAAQAFQGQS
jgi:Transglycosylase SLT domain